MNQDVPCVMVIFVIQLSRCACIRKLIFNIGASKVKLGEKSLIFFLIFHLSGVTSLLLDFLIKIKKRVDRDGRKLIMWLKVSSSCFADGCDNCSVCGIPKSNFNIWAVVLNFLL